MRRWITTAALTVLLIVFAFSTATASETFEPGVAPPLDTREVLYLTISQREAILHEMRGLLESLNGVIQGISQGDRATAAKAARESGIAHAVDLAPGLKENLPARFKEIGVATHKGFDALAAAIDDGANQEAIIEQLANVSTNCVACHHIYRTACRLAE